MGWCQRCGTFFVISTGRPVGRTIGARGRGIGILDVIDTVCPRCLRPDETYDDYGVAIPRETAEAMRYYVEEP